MREIGQRQYRVKKSLINFLVHIQIFRFLYQKLLCYDVNDPEAIYESAGENSDKLRLKPEVSFHMYISTAPCGDGALFSPRDNEIYEVRTRFCRMLIAKEMSYGVLFG